MLAGMPHAWPMDISEIIERGGGVLRLSRALGLHHSSVLGWRKTGRVPAERCLAVAEITGITLHELRPNIYPVPDEQNARFPNERTGRVVALGDAAAAGDERSPASASPTSSPQGDALPAGGEPAFLDVSSHPCQPLAAVSPASAGRGAHAAAGQTEPAAADFPEGRDERLV